MYTYEAFADELAYYAEQEDVESILAYYECFSVSDRIQVLMTLPGDLLVPQMLDEETLEELTEPQKLLIRTSFAGREHQLTNGTMHKLGYELRQQRS